MCKGKQALLGLAIAQSCLTKHLFIIQGLNCVIGSSWALAGAFHLLVLPASSCAMQVISSVSDHTIRVWDSHTGLEVQRLVGHEAQVHILECHPVDHRLAMSASYDGTTKLWNLYTGQALARYGFTTLQQPHMANTPYVKLRAPMLDAHTHITCYASGKGHHIQRITIGHGDQHSDKRIGACISFPSHKRLNKLSQRRTHCSPTH